MPPAAYQGAPMDLGRTSAPVVAAVVVTVRVPVPFEAPVMLTGDVAPKLKVGGSVAPVGLDARAAVRVTLPVNPPLGMTVMVAVLPVVAPGELMLMAPPLVNVKVGGDVGGDIGGHGGRHHDCAGGSGDRDRIGSRCCCCCGSDGERGVCAEAPVMVTGGVTPQVAGLVGSGGCRGDRAGESDGAGKPIRGRDGYCGCVAGGGAGSKVMLPLLLSEKVGGGT